MLRFFMRRLLEQANQDGGAGGGGGDPAAAAAAAAAAGGDKGAPAPGSATALGGATNQNDWIPEKYRVMGADGKTLDVDASFRKTAAGYGELHQRLVAGEGPPKDADAYDAKDLPHGLNFAEMRKDPKMGAWLKGAHAKGMSNAQIQHVFSGFAEYLGADQELSVEECVGKLRETWKDDASYGTNMQAADRAAKQLAQKTGITYDQINKAYGNDPVIVRLLAAIGAEMKEDASVTAAGAGGGGDGGNIDEQIAAIDKQLLELPPGSDKRTTLIEQKMRLYDRKLGKAA